ncbi:MAG: beta-propeller fold lactonase family protein, partial [Lachnospiraceae bacterium]|nr:beta-propeller fold lactonase family protein [Lachnospiraceae bacterium]
KNFCLPVSGDYPKDAELFPGGKFLVSLNHETNNMTFFKVDTKNHTIIMNGPEIKINQPNCIVFYRLDN